MTVERAEKALAKDPANSLAPAGGAVGAALLGEDQKARDWIDRALLVDPDNIMMRYNLACTLIVGLKDRERALEVLGPYFERTVSPTQITHLEADPDLDTVRDDPRFRDMLVGA